MPKKKRKTKKLQVKRIEAQDLLLEGAINEHIANLKSDFIDVKFITPRIAYILFKK